VRTKQGEKSYAISPIVALAMTVIWLSYYLRVVGPSGCLAPGSTDVFGVKTCAARFKLIKGRHSLSTDSRVLTSGAPLESLQDGHYRLMLYSRYNTSETPYAEEQFGRYCQSAILHYGRSCRQQEIVISALGEKMSYCQGAIEPVVHHWSQSLRRVR